jgi:DNA-binding SARP family transcriptional activator
VIALALAQERAGPATPRLPKPEAQHCPTARWDLTLFDSWHLRRGGADVPLHRREQRLVALLALRGERPRGYIAGVLWPESTEQRATGNLRAAVWRIDHEAPGILLHSRSHLRLADPVVLDVDAVTHCAAGIFGWTEGDPPLDRAACLRSLPVLLCGDLLPGWYDDWVSYERARLAQLRLHALELLADLLVDRGEISTALLAASAAVAIEPLREAATRALLRAQIADGNYHGALRDYEAYRTRVQAELGLLPSGRLDELMRPLLEHRIAPNLRSEGCPVVA